jgi:hypothetical protein
MTLYESLQEVAKYHANKAISLADEVQRLIGIGGREKAAILEDEAALHMRMAHSVEMAMGELRIGDALRVAR